MAIRKRTIQPSIWQDPKFGTLGPIAQLLFIGMITQADDEGRVNGHPSVIKSQLFPYSTVVLEDVVDALKEITVKMDNFIYYQVSDQYFGQFKKWSDHQVLREDRMQKSFYPPPPKSHIADKAQPDDGQVGAEVSKEVNKGSKYDGKNYISTIDQVRQELEDKGIVKKRTLI